MNGEWRPQGQGGERATLAEAVGQAISAASMAWTHPEGAGEFDSAEAGRVYEGLMAFLDDHWDLVRKQANEKAAAVRTEPLLGLATTREIMDELRARFQVTYHPTEFDRDVVWRLNALLAKLPAEVLDYRTVDGS